MHCVTSTCLSAASVYSLVLFGYYSNPHGLGKQTLDGVEVKDEAITSCCFFNHKVTSGHNACFMCHANTSSKATMKNGMSVVRMQDTYTMKLLTRALSLLFDGSNDNDN